MSGFQQLVIHNTLKTGVYICTDGSRNSRYAVVMHFSAWSAVY